MMSTSSHENFERLIKLAMDATLSIFPEDRLRCVSIYGSQVSGYPSKGSDLDVLAVVDNFNEVIKYYYLRNFEPTVSLLAVDRDAFLEDATKGSLGEFVAGRLLTPFYPIKGHEFLERVDVLYKKKVVIDLCKNLVLEHKLAAGELLINPLYFLFEKLRRRAFMYPPARYSYSKIFSSQMFERNVPICMKGFYTALDELEKEGIVLRDEEEKGFYRISHNFIVSTLKETKSLSVMLEEFERMFRMYLVHGYAGRLNPRIIAEEVYSKIRRSILYKPKEELPDPESYIFIKTSRGKHPLSEKYDVITFAEKVYNVSRDQVQIKKVGRTLNSTYILTIKKQGLDLKVFVKKYLNWTDFKWIIARIWTIGVKDFSLIAEDRMSNEIYFSNKLTQLGFNVPRIYYVNWKNKTLFMEFIDGVDVLQLWLTCNDNNLLKKVTEMMGEVLAKLHNSNITLGDCKPENFIYLNDRIYITDLEQASIGGDKSWDLMELLIYPGHYLGASKSIDYTRYLLNGYLSHGDVEVLAKGLKERYASLLAPWTPVWLQKKILAEAQRFLRSS